MKAFLSSEYQPLTLILLKLMCQFLDRGVKTNIHIISGPAKTSLLSWMNDCTKLNWKASINHCSFVCRYKKKKLKLQPPIITAGCALSSKSNHLGVHIVAVEFKIILKHEC